MISTTRKTVFRAAVCHLALCSATTALATVFEGFTEPYRKIDVAAAESGTVAQVLVREGDRVTRGQSLAVLDNEVLEVAREIADANTHAQGKLEAARAERELRKTRLERLEPLRSQGHASQEEIDRARTELAVSEANLLSAREQHLVDNLEGKKIQAMIERRIVRSPIDGVVAKLHKEEREYVSNTSASVATVLQLDPLRATFTVPTSNAASLQTGREVGLEFPETALKARGKIEFVAPVTEAESGTVRVKVLLDNGKNQYRCGVRCVLHLGAKADDNSAKPLTAGTPEP